MFWPKRSSRPKCFPRRRFFRPWLERLEDRVVLHAYTASSAVPDGASGSLRYAIIQADTNDDQDNTILLDKGHYALTDTASGNLLVQNANTQKVATKRLIIFGAGQSTTVIEPGLSGWNDRIFQI